MAQLPARIRTNMNLPFPALVTGNAPIALSKSSGIWFINFDMSGFGSAPAGTSSDMLYVLLWRSDIQTFYAEPLTSLVYFGKAVTVAELPSAAALGPGARAFVTDATVSTFASIVSGGGSTFVPVYADDAGDWRIG